MKQMLRWSICALVLVATTSAIAFEVQPGGKKPDGAPAPKAKYGETATPPTAKPEGGTVVRIPGFGKLGVIPQLDFGLELLYGARKSPDTEPAPPAGTPEPENGDLRVRGSVKHRF